MENFREDLTTVGVGISKAFLPSLELDKPEPKQMEREGSGPSIDQKEPEAAIPEVTPVDIQLDEVAQAMTNLAHVPYHSQLVGTNVNLATDFNDLATSPNKSSTIEGGLRRTGYPLVGKGYSYTPISKSKFNSPEEFVSDLYPLAVEATKGTTIRPEFMLAQAAHETGWGKHIGSDGKGSSKNLFGIKADSRWKGKSTSFTTHEYLDGKKAIMDQGFRKYEDYLDSMKDYVDFLHSNPRYKAALSVAYDPKQFASELQKAGYATDPEYANKLIKVMEGVSQRLKKEAK